MALGAVNPVFVWVCTQCSLDSPGRPRFVSIDWCGNAKITTNQEMLPYHGRRQGKKKRKTRVATVTLDSGRKAWQSDKSKLLAECLCGEVWYGGDLTGS